MTRLLGPARTKDLIYTGRLLTAAQAHELGLVDYLVPSSTSSQKEEGGPSYVKACEIAREIAKNGPLAIRAAKLAIDKGAAMDPYVLLLAPLTFRLILTPCYFSFSGKRASTLSARATTLCCTPRTGSKGSRHSQRSESPNTSESDAFLLSFCTYSLNTSHLDQMTNGRESVREVPHNLIKVRGVCYRRVLTKVGHCACSSWDGTFACLRQMEQRKRHYVHPFWE